MTLIIEETELNKLPVTIDASIVSGKPVFAGTRVPVEALISNIQAGVTLNEFLENFPSVKREHALQVLEFYKTIPLKA